MDAFYTTGLVSSLLCLLGGKFLNEKALELLNGEEKIKLTDSFSSTMKFNFTPLISLIALAFLMDKYRPELYVLTAFTYCALLVTFVICTSFLIFRKLTRLELPTEYIRKYTLVAALQHFGVIILLSTLVMN